VAGLLWFGVENGRFGAKLLNMWGKCDILSLARQALAEGPGGWRGCVSFPEGDPRSDHLGSARNLI
jgi:hypothetical protein